MGKGIEKNYVDFGISRLFRIQPSHWSNATVPGKLVTKDQEFVENSSQEIYERTSRQRADRLTYGKILMPRVVVVGYTPGQALCSLYKG